MIISGRKNVAQYYSNYLRASSYIDERFTRPIGKFIHQSQIRFINRLIRRHSVKTVVDLGTGTARIAASLKGFEQGYAIDQSPAMLAYAKNALEAASVAGQWKVVRDNAFSLRLRISADLVTCFKVIRHYPLRDRKRLYASIKKLLKKGGLFVMDVPNYALYRGAPSPIYDVCWTKNSLVAELQDAGFDVASLKPVLCQYFFQRLMSVLSKFGLFVIPYFFIWVLDLVPVGRPYEWIVCARKR